MTQFPDRERELESLLDDISYEVTNARAAGLGKVGELRSALKKMRYLVADADALAGGVEAQRLKS